MQNQGINLHVHHFPVVCFSPANYFINGIYNLFPNNIASSKHLENWENTRVALGNRVSTPLVFSQLSACLDKAVLYAETMCRTSVV